MPTEPLPDQTGRALAIAEIIRGHGPRMAVQLVREADAKHRELNPGGCGTAGCRVCAAFDEKGPS